MTHKIEAEDRPHSREILTQKIEAEEILTQGTGHEFSSEDKCDENEFDERELGKDYFCEDELYVPNTFGQHMLGENDFGESSDESYENEFGEWLPIIPYSP